MSPATEKSTKAKGAKAATKKPEASHPPTAVMIKAAIETLKERKGSSLIAIKKYCATNYKIDPVKMSSFFKKALASGVEKKTILQVKGVGASGSFKLAKEEKKPKKPKTATKKPAASKKKTTAKSKPAASKKATPKKKKVEKSKTTKKAAKPKKPVAKKAATKKPAAKAAPKKK